MSADANPTTIDANSIEYTEFLLACMQARLELLEALMTLADTQSAIGQSDIDTLFGLLARKQALLEELASVQAKMSPYLKDEPNQRVWKSHARREYCRTLGNQAKQILQQTMLIESTTVEQWTARRDAVAAQLQDGKDSNLARTAYMADHFLAECTLDIGDL